MSGKLSDKYICPPLSVWDTRQDYWKKCKKQWDNLGLYSDNGRTNVLGNSQNVTQNSKTGYKTIAVNTSKFDPVIADYMLAMMEEDTNYQMHEQGHYMFLLFESDLITTQ